MIHRFPVVLAAAAAMLLALSACVPSSIGETIPLPSGLGGGAFVVDNGSGWAGGLWGGTLTFDAEGRLTDFTDGTGWSIDDGVVSEFGADGIVAWGRWTGGTTSPSTPMGGGTVRVMHYAVSEVAPDATTLSTLDRDYSPYRSTRPTIEDGEGNVTTGTVDSVSGTLSVDYELNTVDYTLSIPVGPHRFSVSGTAAFAKVGPTDVRILGDGVVTSSTGDVSGGSAGVIPWAPVFQAIVYGANAERIVVEFGFTSDLGVVTGAVVFE